MSLSLKDAARKVLVNAGEPLHYQEITKRIIDGNLSRSKSQTPAASVNAVITVDMKQNGATSDFVRVEPGVIGLRNQGASVALSEVAPDESERRVRIPHFPPYDEVRLVLPVWTGMARARVTGLRATIAQLRGTPQDPVDWSSPDEWIPVRLTGSDQDVALAVWTGTDKRVNPRHVYGHWLLATNYGLLDEDDSGVLCLSERGTEFLKSPGGKAEAALDEAEGLLKLLALVADNGPASFGEFVEGCRHA